MRIFFIVVLVGLNLIAKDPFFLVVVAIIALGVVMTGYAYMRERGARG